MKMFIRLQILFFVLILVSCSEDDVSIVQSNLEGEWIYSSDKSQSLNFTEPDMVSVNGNPFEYELLDNNEIELNYSGLLNVYVPPSRHQLEFDERGSLLFMKNLESLFFFTANPGEETFER